MSYENIFKETEKLMHEYRLLNYWWRNGTVSETIYILNLTFVANMRTWSDRMEKEVIKNFMISDHSKMSVFLSDVSFEVHNNRELFNQHYSKLKIKEPSKIKTGEDLLNNKFQDTVKFINEHTVIVERFISKYTKSAIYKPREKLKWLGKPAQFGWVFLELAKQGFIELPTHNGDVSYSKYAKICLDLFEIDTKPEGFKKNMNPDSNKLSDSNRVKFTFPNISDIS